jgi:Subtilase family
MTFAALRPIPAAAILTASLFCAAAHAQVPAKKHIQTEEDLPRFTYPVTDSIQQLLEADPQTFAAFATPVRADVDRTLADYEIEDHGALRKLLGTRLNLDIILGGNDAAALETIQQIRQLEDKPSEKATSTAMQEAFLRARMANGAAAPGSCVAGYEAAFKSATDPLPWAIAGAGLERERRLLDLMTRPFLVGNAESMLGSTLAKQHSLSLSQTETLLRFKANLLLLVNCKQPNATVLDAYIKKNKVAKQDIWVSREAVLPPADKLTPVNVGIWDSGFDTSLFAGKLFTDPSPSGTDPHGIAFDILDHPTHGDLIPLTPEQKDHYSADVVNMQSMSDMEAGIESEAAKALKQKLSQLTPQQMGALEDEMEIIVGYAHGTHVAGIAALGNPVIRLAYGRITYDNGDPHMAPTDQLLDDNDASYAESVKWFQAHHIRVVNMSWWDRPSNFEKDLADNGIGKDAAERKQLARHYFEMERDSLYAALKGAPDILFVTIAGNSNANNAFEEDIPSSFKLPNLLVTGAVDQSGDETNFTSYGDNVQVHADGFSVESVVPGGAKVRMSGTSMAAPQVTNLAAKLFAINPSLTPEQVIKLIVDGSDASADGRRHLINPKRSVELLQQQASSHP